MENEAPSVDENDCPDTASDGKVVDEYKHHDTMEVLARARLVNPPSAIGPTRDSLSAGDELGHDTGPDYDNETSVHVKDDAIGVVVDATATTSTAAVFRLVFLPAASAPTPTNKKGQHGKGRCGKTCQHAPEH